MWTEVSIRAFTDVANNWPNAAGPHWVTSLGDLTGFLIKFGGSWLKTLSTTATHFPLNNFIAITPLKRKMNEYDLNSIWITIINTMISTGFIPILYHSAWPPPRVLLLRKKWGMAMGKPWVDSILEATRTYICTHSHLRNKFHPFMHPAQSLESLCVLSSLSVSDVAAIRLKDKLLLP